MKHQEEIGFRFGFWTYFKSNPDFSERAKFHILNYIQKTMEVNRKALLLVLDETQRKHRHIILASGESGLKKNMFEKRAGLKIPISLWHTCLCQVVILNLRNYSKSLCKPLRIIPNYYWVNFVKWIIFTVPSAVIKTGFIDFIFCFVKKMTFLRLQTAHNEEAEVTLRVSVMHRNQYHMINHMHCLNIDSDVLLITTLNMYERIWNKE